ncbi:DNA topoisomerase IV subunit A, partial [Paracoccaceae bacterium]|nr:DNA topoisomerase IV subunit A [Paracoccaceae bacterium]
MDQKQDITTALETRYLLYAVSTIMDRALPDARDGLKPVHRRILYAMNQLRLYPQTNFRKCSKIVGEVMGNYHPHGDKAIYDALARFAQNFSVRYPLIEGQGNFGNIDGDNPAAQRYTEARLSQYSIDLLEGLDEDSVDFKETYDSSSNEPTVLPASFPHLLANGASGIAVGMATSIPPHNILELLQACILLVDQPNSTIQRLSEIVIGPDFPTGGIILDSKEDVIKVYTEGRGSFRLRAKHHFEDLKHGNWQLVIDEIPYQVQKGKLIEKIADLISGKKLSFVQNVRDESAEEIRLVIEPRSRNVQRENLLASLYQLTDLETKISVNLNVLIDGISPKVSDLRELLKTFLDHRREILIRKGTYRLENIDKRLEIIEGLLQAFVNLDRIISIIREEDDPKRVIIEEFGLSELQVEAILNLRLRALRRLDEELLSKEQQELMKERQALEDLIEDQRLQWKSVKNELMLLKKKFANYEYSERQTLIEPEEEVYRTSFKDEIVEDYPLTVVLSENGWIRSYKGHNLETSSFKLRDGDLIKFTAQLLKSQQLLFITSEGRSFSLSLDQLKKDKGYGEPLNLMIGTGNVASIVSILPFYREQKGLIFSKNGLGFTVDFASLQSATK